VIPKYSVLICKWVEDGLQVHYERGEVGEICVSQELARDPSWQRVFPALESHYGLVETEGVKPWPGDTVYSVTKPSEQYITIARAG
jgi:hypothetical protein